MTIAASTAEEDTGAHKVTTVVSYCSKERVYIHQLVQNATVFSDLVVVVIGTRLYDGSPEDEAHISQLQQDFADHNVVVERYPVEFDEITKPIPLHNRAREYGVARARAYHDGVPSWYLFLDGDEIPDGQRMKRWLDASKSTGLLSNPSVAFKLKNYWLFLMPRLVAKTHEDSILFIHEVHTTPAALSHPRERDGILQVREPFVRLVRDVPGLDGAPMFWHYSWVRENRDDLKAKVTTWGHKSDRVDWVKLVDQVYDAMEEGKVLTQDFVHGYQLYWVAPDDASHPQPPVSW